MLTDYFSLALKNIRKRGIRSWLTMLGVFVGIAAVVSLISLGQGLETAITGQFGALSTDTLTIQGADTGFSPPGSTSVRKMTEDDLKIVENTPGVKITIPRLLRVAQIKFNRVSDFSFVASMPGEQEKIDEVINSLNIKTAQGRQLESSDRRKIVLGDDFASNDMFGKTIRVGSRLEIQGGEFEVIGILERASTFTLNSVVLMSEEDMREVFNIEDEIDFIVAKVASPEDVEKVAAELERKFRKERNQKIGEEDFEIQTPIEALETVRTIINVINIVVTGIALIALLVGGIGIANTMFTSVLERTKEIGVMKAIGAKNKDILIIFLIEAGLLGFVGGIVGALIGLGLALGASQAANSALGTTILTVSPSPPLLLSSIAFSLVIGIISGIVPAYQASKLNPVEALRK